MRNEKYQKRLSAENSLKKRVRVLKTGWPHVAESERYLYIFEK